MNDKVRFMSEWVTIAFILIHYLLFEIVTAFFHDYHSSQIFVKVTLLIVIAFAAGLYRVKWVTRHRRVLLFLLNIVFCLYLSSEIYFHSEKGILLYILWIFVALAGSYSNNKINSVFLFFAAYLSSSATLFMQPFDNSMITVWEYIIIIPLVVSAYFFISYKADFYKHQHEESEKMLRLVFKHSPAGMMMLSDYSEKLHNVNRQFGNILGYTRAELSNKTMAEISHPKDAAMVPPLLEQAHSSGDYFFTVEKRLIHKTGKEIHVLESLHLLEKKGTPTLIIGSVQDITKRKKAELKEKEYAKNLEESNQNLQEFAYAVSHDLKEPVRTIYSFCQLLPRYLPEKDVRPEVPEFLGFILNSAKRMEMQISDLLLYSRVGQGVLKIIPVNVEESLAQVSRSLGAMIREHGAIIETSGLPVITADKLQLESVFQNLVSNAIKYRKPGIPPHIRISAIRKKGSWQFEVSDNGIGIGVEFLDKIFAVFYRLQADNDIFGTGIGLAVCRRIVKRHGGDIWAESEKGKGTTFYFTIPIQKIKCNGATMQPKQVAIEKNLTSVEVLRAAVR
jgi:PAS domain S-box-containing protein